MLIEIKYADVGKHSFTSEKDKDFYLRFRDKKGHIVDGVTQCTECNTFLSLSNRSKHDPNKCATGKTA